MYIVQYTFQKLSYSFWLSCVTKSPTVMILSHLWFIVIHWTGRDCSVHFVFNTVKCHHPILVQYCICINIRAVDRIILLIALIARLIILIAR